MSAMHASRTKGVRLEDTAQPRDERGIKTARSRVRAGNEEHVGLFDGELRDSAVVPRRSHAQRPVLQTRRQYA